MFTDLSVRDVVFMMMPSGMRLAGPSPLRIGLSDVLSALSYALDLTEGQTPGHALRTCAIGMRLAEAIHLKEADQSALYYALLLKDAGCSSNASRMAALFGVDDQPIKRAIKEVDWQHRLQVASHLWPLITAGGSFVDRCWRVVRLAAQPGAPREVVAIRCDRGATIAQRLGFPAATAEAIRALDEHWNGRGYPAGLKRDAIPLLARIANLAQTFEVFLQRDGVDAAIAVVRSRSGQWFDPALVDVVTRLPRSVWVEATQHPALEPPDHAILVGSEHLDTVAEAFAEIIDAKSPYTYRHSTNVAALARGIGRVMGADAAGEQRLLRAGLLHDIGKLGVSNRILDKHGPLTADERRAVELHPLYTADILRRVGAFREIVDMAARHHERLDGSGYPWHLPASELDPDARALAVADVYEALTAERPYRAPLASDAALALMARDRGSRLCAEAFDALIAFLRSSPLEDG